MSAASAQRRPVYPFAFPLLAILLFGAAELMHAGAVNTSPVTLAIFVIILIPVLIGAVFAAVHHAEVIAGRFGEPYGTLVLTLAVTIIELSLIMSLMFEGPGKPALARDTVFAAFMIVCNGLVGLCIVSGGLRYGEQGFRVRGATAYLNILAPLVTLTLILPNYTLTTVGPSYSIGQLEFVGIVTAALYCVFLYIQTVRHKDYFVMAGTAAAAPAETPRPSRGEAGLSAGFLLAALAGVILLAEKFGGLAESGLVKAGAPAALPGVLVALLVLAPESLAALRAARADDLQKGINLALGSSLATIGLTIPAVSAATIWFGEPLILGIDSKSSVLLGLTLVTSILTFGTGRTNILSGFIHLVLFATFIFLIFVP